MKKPTIILIVLFVSTILHAQIDSTQVTKPIKHPVWTAIVPGASYLYEGKIVKGLMFSTMEVGGLYIGLKYDNVLNHNKNTPYYNYPLWLGMQAYQVEKINYFRNFLEIKKNKHPNFQYDDISDKELYLAPFKVKNIFTPITGSMILLAGIFLTIEKNHEKHTIAEVDKMSYFSKYIARNEALAIYGITSLAMSWGAGVSEEYLLRNYVLPILDYKYGQKKGLLYTSLGFGSIHLLNAFLADKPDYSELLLQVGVATAAGYFIGKDVQKRNYSIGPAVAAHVWYNFALMLGSFLINPEDNYLGVNLQFNLD